MAAGGEEHLRGLKLHIGDPPQRIVQVWLTAGSRWRRFKGDMGVKNIELASPRGITDVT